jgi:hypothetical protein
MGSDGSRPAAGVGSAAGVTGASSADAVVTAEGFPSTSSRSEGPARPRPRPRPPRRRLLRAAGVTSSGSAWGVRRGWGDGSARPVSAPWGPPSGPWPADPGSRPRGSGSPRETSAPSPSREGPLLEERGRDRRRRGVARSPAISPGADCPSPLPTTASPAGATAGRSGVPESVRAGSGVSSPGAAAVPTPAVRRARPRPPRRRRGRGLRTASPPEVDSAPREAAAPSLFGSAGDAGA